MMKLVLPLLFILISSTSFCQDDFQIILPQNQVLYRGVENYVQFLSNSKKEDFEISCVSCDTLYETETPGNYAVRVGRGKFTEFVVISKSKPSKVLGKMKLNNFHLPNPNIYFGATGNGGKCSKHQAILFAKYPPEMNLNHQFDVVSWELIIGEKSFEGEGKRLNTEAINELKQTDISIISSISFIVVVEGPDGIKRRTGAAYSL